MARALLAIALLSASAVALAQGAPAKTGAAKKDDKKKAADAGSKDAGVERGPGPLPSPSGTMPAPSLASGVPVRRGTCCGSRTAATAGFPGR